MRRWLFLAFALMIVGGVHASNTTQASSAQGQSKRASSPEEVMRQIISRDAARSQQQNQQQRPGSAQQQQQRGNQQTLSVGYNCGGRAVRVVYGNSGAIMDVAGKRYQLQRVQAGGTTRYETAAGSKPSIVLWYRGSDTLVTANGQTLPVCQETDAN